MCRTRSLCQVWLEMSHLDYCSANFFHVVNFFLILPWSRISILICTCYTSKWDTLAGPLNSLVFWRWGTWKREMNLWHALAPYLGQLPEFSLTGTRFTIAFLCNIKRRRERELSAPVHSLERRELLQRVAHLEEEFFSVLTSSLPCPAAKSAS